jgi:hypothetical protein
MSDCNWLTSGKLDNPGYLVCSVGLLTMSYSAEALAGNLNTAAHPTGTGETPRSPFISAR